MFWSFHPDHPFYVILLPPQREDKQRQPRWMRSCPGSLSSPGLKQRAFTCTLCRLPVMSSLWLLTICGLWVMTLNFLTSFVRFFTTKEKRNLSLLPLPGKQTRVVNGIDGVGPTRPSTLSA